MNKDLSYIGVFKNEAKVVRVVLDIMKPVCTEMYLGVQKSDDHTLKICREYTDNVFEREPEAPFYTKDFLMSQVKTEWACWFDADEIPSYQLVNYLRSTDLSKFTDYEAIRVPRINYVDGVICMGGQPVDYQFTILRKDVRWNPTPERAIHIWPKVTNHFTINYPVFHHRSLDKIANRTKDWDKIQPDLKEACHSYLENVKKEVYDYKGGVLNGKE
jgi:hypothetical protein